MYKNIMVLINLRTNQDLCTNLYLIRERERQRRGKNQEHDPQSLEHHLEHVQNWCQLAKPFSRSFNPIARLKQRTHKDPHLFNVASNMKLSLNKIILLLLSNALSGVSINRVEF